MSAPMPLSEGAAGQHGHEHRIDSTPALLGNTVEPDGILASTVVGNGDEDGEFGDADWSSVQHDDDDDDDEAERFARIREREKRSLRPWHSSSAPTTSLSGQPQTFVLAGGKEITFCDRPFPPHGGEIVATGGIVWDSALVLSQ